MKKTILTFMALFLAQTCFGAIGYVDYNVIYNKLPISQQYKKKIDSKAQEVRKYNLETQAMVKGKSSLDERSKIREQRKETLIKLEREYISLRYEQEKVVKNKVEAASQTVMAQKGLDMIIDKKSRITGGVDCTFEVLKAIK